MRISATGGLYRAGRRWMAATIVSAVLETVLETVLVDAENVRRSRWPNLTRAQLVESARRWAGANGLHLVVVFDGPPPEEAPDLVAGEPSADDWLARHAAEHVPYWLVTSDRELRRRAGGAAAR